MTRSILRGALAAVLLVACSDATTTTSPSAPLAPTARAPRSLGLANGRSADTLLVGATRQLSVNVATAARTTTSLTNGKSGGCLAVANGARNAGAPVRFEPCAADAPHQTWGIAGLGTPGAVTVYGGALCLDNWGAREQVGDRVGTWNCVGGASAQTFTMTASGELRLSNGLCVEARGDDPDGTATTLQVCNGAASQRWSAPALAVPGTQWTSSNPTVAAVSATGLVTGVSPGVAAITAISGAYRDSVQIVVTAAGGARVETALINPGTGECLAIANDRQSLLVPAVLSPCSGSAGQRWSVAGQGSPGAVTAFGGSLCLDNWGARGNVGDRVGTWSCVAGAPAQTWTLTAAGDLRMSNGLCVQAGASGTQVTLQSCSGAANQRWSLPGAASPAAPVQGSNDMSLANAAGDCMSVGGDQLSAGVAVTVGACAGSAGQRWKVPATGSAGLVSVSGTSVCLDNWGARGLVGDAVGSWYCVAGARTQTWTLTGAGALQGVNGLCVQAGSRGTQLTLQTCDGSNAQRWSAVTPGTIPGPVASAPTTSLPTPTTSEPVTSATPQLPQRYVDTRLPMPTGRVIAVAAGGDLQAALDAAQPGDVVTLANGATYVGNFMLNPKPAGGWITVRPASMGGLPAEGERLAPARHAAAMPKIVSPNGMFALATPDWGGLSSRGWRFVGVEFATSPQADYAQALVQIGTGNEPAADQLSSHFVFDRVWIHGQAGQQVSRCMSLNSAHSAVIDSYFSNCQTRNQEGQLIQTWGSPGPLKIQNNHLEGGTIGVLVGGADPRIAGLMPSDIEVRGNHFFKPLSWKGVYQVKNALEFKNAQRVLVEGNVFENNWADAQAGFLILFSPRTQYEQAPWSTVRDVTFRHNVLRNAPNGFQIAGRTSGVQTHVLQRVRIEHNLLERVGGHVFQVARETEDVVIAHNSVPDAEYASVMFAGGETGPPVVRFVFRDNLVGRGAALVSGAYWGEGALALARYTDGAAAVAGNLAFSTSQAGTGRTDLYPTANAFVADAAAAGVVSGTVNGIVVSRAQLASTSPYYRAGTGGRTPGADLPEVARRTATAVQP